MNNELNLSEQFIMDFATDPNREFKAVKFTPLYLENINGDVRATFVGLELDGFDLKPNAYAYDFKSSEELLTLDDILFINNKYSIDEVDDCCKGNMYGFDFLYSFIKTSNGWFYFSDDCACFYCFRACVLHNGTREDKIFFNKYNEEIININHKLIPVTNKELAISNKKAVKAKKRKPNFNINKISNKDLNNVLRSMKQNGVNIIRRGKNNLYKGVYFANFNGKDYYFEIKGYNDDYDCPHLFMECFSSEDEIFETVEKIKESLLSNK